MPSHSSLRGILCMVLAAFSFVSNDSFLKLMLADMAPLQALFLRGCVASVWCFVLLAGLGQLRQTTLAFSPWIIGRALCEVVAVTCFIVALAHVPLADVTAIYQISPLVVLAAASFIWGEHIGPVRWVLIALGVAGALFVAQPGTVGASPYALLGFITAFAGAARDLMSRNVPRAAPGLVTALAVIVTVMLTSALGTFLFEDWAPLTTRHAALALGAGFFLVFGQFFVFMAFRLAAARAVAPFNYTSTLFAVSYGAVIFSEFPNPLAIVGIMLIIACGVGVLLVEQNNRTQQ